MKLRAVRVRDVGHFSEGAAIEGLSGGLDVLVAPNEAGKSTLLRALEVVFFEKYDSANKRIQAITPVRGGSPLIEADFEADGGLWRITKQFGRGKRALLTSLKRSSDGASVRDRRNGDADEAMARLVGLDDGRPGRLGFLWVGQGLGLEPVALDEKRGEAAAFAAILEREVATMANGGVARHVRGLIAKELAGLRQPKQPKPKAGGPWALALAHRDGTKTRFEAATAALARTEARERELAAVRLRLVDVTDPVQRAAWADDVACAQQAVTVAESALRLLDQAQTRCHESDRLRQLAEDGLTAFERRCADEAECLVQLAAGETRLAEATVLLASRRQALADIEAEGDALRRAQDEAQVVVQGLQEERIRSSAREQLKAVAAAYQVATALSASIVRREQALAAHDIDGVAVDRLILAERRVQRARDAQSAGAPHVTIAYLPGAEGRLLVGGLPASAGRQSMPLGALEIDVPGIGTIAIAAAATSEAGALAADARAAEVELAAGLSALGVATLDAARGKLDAARELRTDLGRARAELSGLAPAGLDVLGATFVQLTQRLEGQSQGLGSAAPSEADAEQAVSRLADLKASLDALRGRYRSAREVVEDVARQVERERTLGERLRVHHGGLLQNLPPVAERGREAGRLQTAADVARRDAAMALRELAALRDSAPDPKAVAALRVRLDLLNRLQADRERDRHDLTVRATHLAAEQGIDDEQGLASQVPQLGGELEQAEVQVEAVEREVEALSMIADAIDAAEQSTLGRYLAPVQRALDPYLQTLFPRARLVFGRDMQVDTLERADDRHRLDLLSSGTREQIAILMRLAFARVMADAGLSAPVIFDDALVYSDDQRLSAMHGVLRQASSHHQVIVLSCRSTGLPDLGASPLAIGRWTPA